MIDTTLVKDIVEELNLAVACGEAYLNREITRAVLSRPAVEIHGDYFEFYESDRIQIIGSKESQIFRLVPEKERQARANKLFSGNPPAFIFTGHANEIFKEFQAASEQYKIPILVSNTPTTSFMSNLSEFLTDALADKRRIHGVMMEVHGIGVLLVGKSSIGKSETALELIMRGHTLISDDSVEIYQKDIGVVMASVPKLIERLMEIRGLGLVDVVDLFGVNSFKKKTKLSLMIELVRWDQDEKYNRLGTSFTTHRLFDSDIPVVSIPVRPGRNIASLVEIASMNWRLRKLGRNAADEFMKKQKAVVSGEANLGEDDDDPSV